MSIFQFYHFSFQAQYHPHANYQQWNNYYNQFNPHWASAVAAAAGQHPHYGHQAAVQQQYYSQQPMGHQNQSLPHEHEMSMNSGLDSKSELNKSNGSQSPPEYKPQFEYKPQPTLPPAMLKTVSQLPGFGLPQYGHQDILTQQPINLKKPRVTFTSQQVVKLEKEFQSQR